MATKEEEKKGEGERPSDLEILEQINTIQDESKHALCVGNLVDINLLKIEYKDATSTMKSKIEVNILHINNKKYIMKFLFNN